MPSNYNFIDNSQNLLTYSEQFDSANWSKANTTITSNVTATTAPDGTYSADKLVEDTSNVQHIAWQSRTGTNETMTFSVFCKAAERSKVYLQHSNFVDAAVGVIYDLSNGTIVSTFTPASDYTNISSSIVAYPNGWYRCILTATKGSVNTTNTPTISITNASNVSVYPGDGTSGIYIWGAQIERKSSAGNYVQTFDSPYVGDGYTYNFDDVFIPAYKFRDSPLWVWGNGSNGRLGTNNTTNRLTPVTTFAGKSNWKSVSNGYFHTAAIKTDGTLWVWGYNNYGQLGINQGTTISPKYTPVTTFAGGTDWNQVEASGASTMAIKTDGTLWTWGRNSNGVLGTNDLIQRSTPVTTFAGGTNWKQISVILNNAAAIKTDGTLWTWGNNGYNQLGIAEYSDPYGDSGPCSSTAQLVGTETFIPIYSRGYRITTSSGTGTVTEIPYNILGPASLTPDTTVTSGSNDDGYFGPLTLPFNITFNGTSYNTIYVVTNSYITFGSVSVIRYPTYNSPALNKLLISATDGKCNTLYYGTEGTSPNRTYRVRFDGDGLYSGGRPLRWEAIFYENNPTQIDVQVEENGNIKGSTRSRSTPVTTFAGGTNWKQVTAGDGHTAAIKTDGTLWVWGYNNLGQLGTKTPERAEPVTTVGGGTDWKQVSAGVFHTAAIKTDGTLWVWGYDNSGQLGKNLILTSSLGLWTPVTTFAGGTNWADTPTTNPEDLYTVSAGQYYTAAIKTDGTLWVWGNSDNGKLGFNPNLTSGLDKSTPITTFAGGTNWKQVSTGNFHTAAIKTDGTLWVWGYNNYGQLGINNTSSRQTPVTTFAGGTTWKQVSVGYTHTASIKTDGTLWTWGRNTCGQLGKDSHFTIFAVTPITTFAGGTNWADTPTTNPEDLYTVSAGNFHTAALKTDGTLWTWGRGTEGQLGVNDTVNRNTPTTTFVGGTTWKQVSAGYRYSTAIKTDGTLWVWGNGGSGQLGTNEAISKSTPVTTFAGGTDWKQVSSGVSHTSAIKTDGTLWTWGYGGNGRLGTNDTTRRFTPVTTFAGGTDWKQVSSGSSHTSAIKTDGTLWVWGRGGDGQLGTSDNSTRLTPVTTFTGGTNWKQVSAGYRYSTAIKTDGTLWTWGYGLNGRLGINDATSNRLTPVTTFAGGTNWKQVSNSNSADSTSAIKTDGTLWVWGNNGFGKLGTSDNITRSTPTTTFVGGTTWKQVSNGTHHIIALQDDGINKRVYVWGLNSSVPSGTVVDFGTLGISQKRSITTDYVPATTFAGGTDWKQVSCSAKIQPGSDLSVTTAVKTDGTLWVWGNNRDGQLGIYRYSDFSRFTPVTTFAGGTNWKQVSAGGRHTSAIKTDGTLWTWGYNNNGQLGINVGSVIAARSTPVTTFAGGTDWKQVSNGWMYTAAIKTDGTLWTWGYNNLGQLGTNDTITRSTPATTFAGGTNWKQVDVGRDHTIALNDNGVDKRVYVWGGNSSVQLSIEDYDSSLNYVPATTFAGGTNWKQVSSGRNNTSAIKTDGTLWLWGENGFGQLGNNSTQDVRTPVTTFAGGTNWKLVDTGFYHLSAIIIPPDPVL